MNRNSFYILFLVFISCFNISALDDTALWVKFEEAKNMYEKGDFQEALDFFLEVTKNETPYPEAEYMIGLLYLEEGELAIAEEQINKAIRLSLYLQVPEEILNYKYTLARVSLLKGDYDNYTDILKEIIGNGDIDLSEVRDQKAYYDTVLESGFDRLLHLYRKQADNVVNARIYLGYYYNSIGDYKSSVNYLLSPVLSLISEVIQDNMLKDREYTFKSITLFFDEVKKNDRVKEYFEEHDFYKLVYYLGESLYGLGHKERALEAWGLLVNSGLDSLWINKSRKQISNPTLEEWKFLY